MDKKTLVALLSSIISDLLLLLLTITPQTPYPNTPLTNFLAIPQTSTILSILSKKRKQPDSLEYYYSPIPRTPESFKLFFKMTSTTFEWLAALLEPLLECRDPGNESLGLRVETRLGIGLFRLATGSDYGEVSKRFDVSEPVARFCVNQFCRVLCTNFRFWVGFPTQNELRLVSESFERLTGLPDCCGVMQFTTFNISGNGSAEDHGLDPEAVAAQIVVDSSSRILSIVAGFNAKKGNEFVLKSSSLYDDIVSKKMLNSEPIDIDNVRVPQYLIGEKGYPFLPWLMVPYDNTTPKSCEENFNSAHSLMMTFGYRTVDSLRKWGVLSKPINEEVKTMVGYIGACSILHNALLMREDYSSLSQKFDEPEYSRDSMDDGFGADLFDQKAVKIRSALATRARRCV